jgi:hypothetical protein
MRTYFCPPQIDAVKQFEQAQEKVLLQESCAFHIHPEGQKCSQISEEPVLSSCWVKENL